MPKTVTIVSNEIICPRCGKHLRSQFRWDYQACDCHTAADGGPEYLRRAFTADGYIECSIVYDEVGQRVRLWQLVTGDSSIELLPPFPDA